MKKFRFLTVLALAISMLFVVAAAADYSFDAIEYDGSADTVTVVVKATGDYTVDMYGTFQLMYNEAVFAIDTDASAAASTTYAMTFYDYTGDVGYGAVCASNEGGDLAVTKDSVILKAVFNVLDKAAAVGESFAWDESGTLVCNVGEMLDYTGSVTVESAAPAAEAPTYTGTVNPKATLNGVDDVYTGVWAANYTVALNGNDITKVGLRFAGKSDDAFAVAKTADGEGSVAFKIAIVGAPADAVATPIVYTTEWIAAEAE